MSLAERLRTVEHLPSWGGSDRSVAASASGTGLVGEEPLASRKHGIGGDSLGQVGLDVGVDLVGSSTSECGSRDEGVVILDVHGGEADESLLGVEFMKEEPAVLELVPEALDHAVREDHVDLGADLSDRSATPGCERRRPVRACSGARRVHGGQSVERLNAAGVMSATWSPNTSRRAGASRHRVPHSRRERSPTRTRRSPR